MCLAVGHDCVCLAVGHDYVCAWLWGMTVCAWLWGMTQVRYMLCPAEQVAIISGKPPLWSGPWPSKP